MKSYQNNQMNKEDVIHELMLHFGSQVTRLAYTYVNDMSTAEDITQEVFITCYDKLDQFHNKASMKTWVYRITINKSKDHLRTGWRKYMSFHYLFDIFTSDTMSPELTVIEQSKHDELTQKSYHCRQSIKKFSFYIIMRNYLFVKWLNYFI